MSARAARLKALRKQMDDNMDNHQEMETGSNSNSGSSSKPPDDPIKQEKLNVSSSPVQNEAQCGGCCPCHHTEPKCGPQGEHKCNSSEEAGSAAKQQQPGPKLSKADQAQVDKFYQQVYMDSHLNQGYVTSLAICGLSTRNRKYMRLCMYFLFIKDQLICCVQANQVSQVGG